MALTLIVLRHAKSGWGNPSLPDHARALTDRGHRDARAVGVWLGARNLVPDLILSSDATRTRQTVAELSGGLGQDVPTEFLPSLYNASSDTIERTIRKQSGKVLLLCAHNPGIGNVAAALATEPPEHPRFDDYPTAATTVLSFDADDWSDIKTGACRSFVIPADLKT